MRVLGLDPGTNCGWSVWDSRMYLSGTWHLQPKSNLSCGDHPLIYLRGHLRKTWEQAGPFDLIIFEEPVGYVQSIGRTITAVAAGSQKIGIVIAFITEMKELGHEVHWHGIKPHEVKSFARDRARSQFPTKGMGDKDAMFNAAKEYFGTVPVDYDAADALWVCAWGKENYEASLDTERLLKESIEQVSSR